MKKILYFILILLFSATVYASNRVTPVSQAVQQIQDSVVNIRTEKTVQNKSPFNDPFFDDFFGFSNSYKTQSLGSGVIISNDGVVITNNHVIEAASKIFVILFGDEQLEAEVIGTDPLLDIAVIKLKGFKGRLKSAKLGTSSDIMLGETVIAMGNPYGLNSSVTTGVVSNVKRVVGDKDGFSIFIQTDALINPGNSGGPLINLDGEVIGINTAIFRDAQGIGFSIPIDTVKRAVNEFVKYGKIRRGYPGFTVQEKQTTSGTSLIVTEVLRGSSAEKAGIKPNDRLAILDNIPVNTIDAYTYIMRTFPVGETIPAVIEKDGKKRQLYLNLSEFPANYGLSILNVRYGITFKESQNYITVETSKIEQYARKGDILLAINDKELSSSEYLAALLNEYAGETVTLTFVRNNRIHTLRLKL